MRERLRRYEFFFSLGLILFFIVFLLLAPLFHEAWHIMTIRSQNLKYRVKYIKLGVIEGTFGEIEYEASSSKLINFQIYVAGVFGNLMVGFLLLFLSFYTCSKHPCYSIVLGNVAIAFLADSSLYFFFEMDGDLVNALKLFKFENEWFLPTIGFLLVSFCFYSWIKILEKTSENYLQKIYSNQ